MLVACWSPKGGSGTTVVTCGLAVLAARSSPTLLVDLAGEVPAVLGLPEPDGPGSVAWLLADDDVPVGRLPSLEVPAGSGLTVLPRGAGTAGDPSSAGVARPGPTADRLLQFTDALRTDDRRVIADCGLLGSEEAVALAAAAPVGLLVLRPCYLALRRALLLPVRPTGVVLVRERERALARTDVEEVLGVPVQAQVDVDPAVARAVDAGLLGRRLPRTLERCLRGAA